MKTVSYNPSKLEVDFAEAVLKLKSEIEKNLPDCKIVDIENKIKADNPMLLFQLQDKDGDMHSLVLKIIQRPDQA